MKTILFVVIPTSNRMVKLQETLWSFSFLRYQPDLEILVIDNDSDNGTNVGPNLGVRILELQLGNPLLI